MRSRHRMREERDQAWWTRYNEVRKNDRDAKDRMAIDWDSHERRYVYENGTPVSQYDLRRRLKGIL